MRSFFYLIPLCIVLFSCAHKNESADLIIHNAIVYTLDDNNTVSEAIAVKDGKIIEIGAERQILNKYSAEEYLDAKGRPVYPGFFDAHCHILNYGLTFLEVDLRNTTSWDACLEKIKKFAEKSPSAWIKGRGWDQNLWSVKEFPTNEKLNALFPDQPVYFSRIDGHAAIVNNKALELAGIDASTEVNGGTIVRVNGVPTGVLIDNAMDLVAKKIPAPTIKEMRKALVMANANTCSYGLTTLCDAGNSIDVFKEIESLQKENKFMAKVYGMLVPGSEEFEFARKNKHYQKEKMTIRSFKLLADGALGSRGACLKDHYSDATGVFGKLIYPLNKIDSLIDQIDALNYQVNTHCIGDSANSVVLKLYAKYLEKTNDLRWRIEHAQIMDINEFPYFQKYSIIPSVQPTHAVSDMPWARDRVGDDRLKGGYAFYTLMQQNGMVALGTDFPVEEVNPFKTFYAAVTNKYYDGKTIEGFRKGEVLSRLDALKGMTKWAALACFMEEQTGSIEVGKCADIIVLNKDILKVDESELLNTMVIHTFINGKRVHSLE